MSQWIIQSVHQGPVHLQDVGIMLTFGQTRDLDLIGREAAERSKDVKSALDQKLVRTVKKDPYAAPGIDASVIQKLSDAGQQAAKAAESMQASSESNVDMIRRLESRLNEEVDRNKRLEDALAQQRDQTNKVLESTNQVLLEVREYAKQHPLEIRAIKDVLETIKTERGIIAKQIEELPKKGLSETELKAQERILKMRDAKLEKNYQNLGNTVSSSAQDVQSKLDAMDELGIGEE